MSHKKSPYQQEVRRDVSVAMEDSIASGSAPAVPSLPARPAMCEAPEMPSIGASHLLVCAYL